MQEKLSLVMLQHIGLQNIIPCCLLYILCLRMCKLLKCNHQEVKSDCAIYFLTGYQFLKAWLGLHPKGAGFRQKSPR